MRPRSGISKVVAAAMSGMNFEDCGDADDAVGLGSDVRDRIVADIYTRWVNLVLLARIGNGTWHRAMR